MNRAGVLNGVGTGMRFGLATVWLVSGTTKAMDPDRTSVAVRAYDVLPRAGVGVVAAVLPFFELALGILLVVGVGTRVVAGASAVLLGVFVAGVAQAWARGLAIECGCFGGGGAVAPGATTYVQEIARDVGLLGLAAWLVVRPATLFGLEDRLTRRT